MNPLISTITPCFNMGKYLPLFLEELPRQTIFDQIEIVLDHNDPTDEELDLVKQFQQNYPGRLKHIITTPVEPIGVSMNTCIKESSGDFLTIWNVDDLRTPYSIEEQLKHHKRTGCDFIHGNFVIVNQFGSKYGKYIDHTQYTGDNPEVKRAMAFGPFFMFKKELLKKTGMFDEQLKSAADYDLCMKLVRNSDVECVPKVLGYYLDEGKGASTRGDGLQQLERTVVEMRYSLPILELQYINIAKEKYRI